jgi:LPPG:FO 2-phospho-L-lactate transferase
LRDTKAIVVAITPIIGGKALKGPAADMLQDLGHKVSASGVAALYLDFIDLFVLDANDALLEPEIRDLGKQVVLADTVMTNLETKKELARIVIQRCSEQR